MESRHEWSRPVTINMPGKSAVVLSPAAARNILLLQWPGDHTDRHKNASDACLAAMEGADPEVAWLAFVEAGIYEQ